MHYYKVVTLLDMQFTLTIHRNDIFLLGTPRSTCGFAQHGRLRGSGRAVLSESAPSQSSMRSYNQLVLPSVTGKLHGGFVCSTGPMPPVDARAVLEDSDQTLWVLVVLRLTWVLDHIHDATVLGDVDM
jgi:hypothetical protein